jgi:hypothetical protein
MKDVEFISILMLLILEKDFVGFPQYKIDELYAKYDFSLDELPEDEVALGLQDQDNAHENSLNFTKEDIASFEERFGKTIKFILSMENHNNCITNHKKRLFTDFYSLWAALVFDVTLIEKGAEVSAQIYESFISKIDEAYVWAKEGKELKDLDAGVQIYYANSTGAATEIEPRKQRHKALLEYANQ